MLGGKMSAYRLFVGKHGGSKPLGRSRYRWEDILKTGLREIGWRAWTLFIWFKTKTSGVLL
jgi:hypothetical protein